jgi:hypothetical protein
VSKKWTTENPTRPKKLNSAESNFEEQCTGMNTGAEVKSLFTSYAYFLQQCKNRRDTDVARKHAQQVISERTPEAQ